MFVVRYIALAALVVWLGAAVVTMADTMVGGLAGHFHLVVAGCGAVIFICLFIMKFIGPPPPAFALRAGLAFAIAVAGQYLNTLPRTSTAVITSEVAIGLVLLSWYARE